MFSDPEWVVSVMLAAMFMLGMVTYHLLERGDVWTTVRHWWHAR